MYKTANITRTQFISTCDDLINGNGSLHLQQ